MNYMFEHEVLVETLKQAEARIEHLESLISVDVTLVREHATKELLRMEAASGKSSRELLKTIREWRAKVEAQKGGEIVTYHVMGPISRVWKEG